MNIAYRSESENNLMQRSSVTKRHLKVRICLKVSNLFSGTSGRRHHVCEGSGKTLKMWRYPIILINFDKEYKSSLCRKYISYAEFIWANFMGDHLWLEPRSTYLESKTFLANHKYCFVSLTAKSVSITCFHRCSRKYPSRHIDDIK